MVQNIGQVCEGRRNNFDFIRFVAASMVIYSHAFPLSAGRNDGELLKDLTDGLWSFGSLAVAIFFVISGFLISQSYDRSNAPLVFAKARILRIFPALAVVLLLSSFVLGPIVTTLPLETYLGDSQTYQYLKTIFLYPLYWNLPGCFENNVYSPSVNGSLWTIPFEVFFYGVVLLLGIMGLLEKRKVALAGYIGFLLLAVFKHTLFPMEGHIFSLPKYSFIDLGLYYFAGMVCFTYRDRIPLDKHYAMLSAVALAVCVVLGQYVIPFSIFGTYLIMYLAFSEKIRLYNFAKYGDFSYGVYIYGFPVQQAVVHFYGGEMDPYANMLWSYPIVILCAAASWHLVEKPFMRLKKLGRSHFLSENGQTYFRKAQKKVQQIFSLGWGRFAALLCIAAVAVALYFRVPSIIDFPHSGESIFLSGWLPQTQTEDYR